MDRAALETAITFMCAQVSRPVYVLPNRRINMPDARHTDTYQMFIFGLPNMTWKEYV